MFFTLCRAAALLFIISLFLLYHVLMQKSGQKFVFPHFGGTENSSQEDSGG
jgi:preprotein translocase subunit SecG